jgi:hypothetical protein
MAFFLLPVLTANRLIGKHINSEGVNKNLFFAFVSICMDSKRIFEQDVGKINMNQAMINNQDSLRRR